MTPVELVAAAELLAKFIGAAPEFVEEGRKIFNGIKALFEGTSRGNPDELIERIRIADAAVQAAKAE
jgi:hypothetical protein